MIASLHHPNPGSRDPHISLAPAATSWRAMVKPYLKPDGRRALIQVVTTGLPFLVLMTGTLIALHQGLMEAMFLFPISAVLLVRLFMFQHDCGHGSFFQWSWANNVLGWTLGILTLTPYTSWRRDHAAHHASSGNLDRRGIGDVTTLTMLEYLALPRWRRFAYRLYRHPLVMFGVGPFWLFFILNRIPVGDPRRRWRDWISIIGTNLALAAILTPLLLILGPAAVLLGLLPVMLLAATIGVWLFYVQHQFKETYWESQPRWEFHASALQGASFYDLPVAMHWMTGNIGFHHIHHLSSKIPNYRLRECHEANPAFQGGPRLTLWSSFRSARLALWDEEAGELISFRNLGRHLMHRADCVVSTRGLAGIL